MPAYINDSPKSRLYIGLAAIAIVIISGFTWKMTSHKAAAEEIVLVRAEKVGHVDAAQKYTYAGEVRGRYESQLAFQVGGKVIKRNVELGQKVQAGEMLMQLDAKDSRQALNINSAQVYSANSQLKLAESNLRRYGSLYEQNAISRMEYEQMQNAYDAAVAGARQASAQYSQGVNQLDYTTLCADSDGVIAGIDAETGKVVSAGQTVVTLVRDSELEVEINVPENRIEEVRQAKQLKISFWALPNLEAAGQVREVSPLADAVTRTFKVRVGIQKPPPEIKLGMTASVAVGSNTKQLSAIYIPLSAVYQNNNTPAVWVINDGVVILRPVTLGAFGDNQVQVSSGLTDGDVIVTAGVHKLREGQKVRLAAGGSQ